MRDYNDIIEQNQRITQRDLIPRAVSSRNVGKFITITSLASASTVLSNGDRAVFTFTQTNTRGDDTLNAEEYISFYVGSVSSANQLPGGSGVTDTQWSVIGPLYNYQTWAGNTYTSKATVSITNISAGASQTVLSRSQVKYFSITPA